MHAFATHEIADQRIADRHRQAEHRRKVNGLPGGRKRVAVAPRIGGAIIGALCVIGLAACGGAVADDVVETRDGDWTTPAYYYRDSVGERFAFVCPPGGSQVRTWGTDVYTDDSSVCTAAVHAGEITFDEGGSVVVEIRPGEDRYEGSERNGVTTVPYGSWHGSFVFPDATNA